MSARRDVQPFAVVARMVTRGHERRSASVRSAHAATRCSQLSSTSKRRRCGATRDRVDGRATRPVPICARRRLWDPRRRVVTGASSTSQTHRVPLEEVGQRVEGEAGLAAAPVRSASAAGSSEGAQVLQASHAAAMNSSRGLEVVWVESDPERWRLASDG